MRRVVLVALLFAVAACADRSPLAPDAFGRAPCRPPSELVAMVITPPFAPLAMRSALIHSADALTLLIVGTPQRDLQVAFRSAATKIEIGDYDSACRFVALAYGVLRTLPPTPATLPERDAMRLILALTAQSLSGFGRE